jgi:hypothetical protein
MLAKHGYQLVNLPVTNEDEDFATKTNGYYFAKSDVVSMYYYHSFGTSATITLADGTKLHMLSNNINSNDKSALRIDHNDYVSPKFVMDDVWIEARDVMTRWLVDHGVPIEILKESSREFQIYETIEYPGVPTPSKEFGRWSYSSEALVLNETEIETALNSIENELLRKKIECILYARVFKRR